MLYLIYRKEELEIFVSKRVLQSTLIQDTVVDVENYDVNGKPKSTKSKRVTEQTKRKKVESPVKSPAKINK